jgi:hypothetical protein
MPKEMNGNKQQPKIFGHDQFLLLFYRSVFPKANADEIRCFIFENSQDPIIYSRQDITRSEQSFQLTKKRGSTTAYEAFLPENIQRRWLYFNSEPLTGILHVNRNEMIDIEVPGIGILHSNRRFGKQVANVRVGDIGPYSKSEKFTLIAAVGPPDFKHMFMAKVPGTTTELFTAFNRSLLLRFPQGTPRKDFLFDNLRSHFSDEILYEIYNQGHRITPRPAYYPADGPIEYIFNQIEMGLSQNLYKIRTDDDIIACTRFVFTNLQGIDATFRHCGY